MTENTPAGVVGVMSTAEYCPKRAGETNSALAHAVRKEVRGCMLYCDKPIRVVEQIFAEYLRRKEKSSTILPSARLLTSAAVRLRYFVGASEAETALGSTSRSPQ